MSMSRLPIQVQDSLLPTLEATMNVFETTKSFEMKKAIFSKSSATNDGPPVTKMDSYLTVHEEASQKINDNEPVKMESRHVEERHEADGKSEQSSQSFSFGNLDVQNKIKANKECTVASLKPARKQTAPRFICTIDGAIVDEGADVKFEAVVESYPPANIVWYKNNEQLFDQPDKISITWELNRATLKLKNVHGSDAGRYSCSASNDAGSASSSADLFVKKNIFPPVMGKRLHPQSVAVGKRVTFEVEVTGTPTPVVTWFKDDNQLVKISPFYRLREQGNSHALIIEKARLEDSGQYKVRAHNEAGEAVSIATLNIFEPPTSASNNITSQYSLENQSLDSHTTSTNNFEARNYSSQFGSSHKSEFKSVEMKTDKKIKFNVDENDKPIEFVKEFEPTPELEIKSLIEPIPIGETKTHVFDSFSKEESYSKNTNGFKETNLYSMEYSKCNNEPAVQKESHSSFSSYEPNAYSNTFILEPGPPPEMGYIPKEAVPKAREAMAERVKKLESSQRQLSPVEIPPGAVKIFPTIVPRKKDTENSVLQKKYSSCIKEYKQTLDRSLSQERESTPAPTPNILISETTQDNGPVYRPQANIDLRPSSPRPSAEGVSMEKLWSHKRTEETTYRPVTPKIDSEPKFKVCDIKRSLSPLPSAEGVAMDKLWSHPASSDKRRPHSVIGLSEEASTEKVTESTWAHVAAPSAEHETKESYKSHVVEDKKIVSSAQRSAVEEKGKKKFKWPPQEVSFEDSLVRKTSSTDKFNLEPGPPPEISFAQAPANFEQSSYVKTKEQDLEKNIDQTAQKYVYGGVRVVPAPTKSFSSTFEKQESSSYQTLPRSFKFASSSDSKFKPVKPFVKANLKQKTDSDYEYDSEVTKINVQYPQTVSKETVSEKFSSDGYSIQKESFSSFSDHKVTTDGTTHLRESGYAADTDEPTFKSTFLQKSTGSTKPIFSSPSYQKYDGMSKTQTFPRTSENKIIRTVNDSSKTTTKTYAPTYTPPAPKFSTLPISPSKFSKTEYRESDYESDYDARIPPIWRPSDSEPEEPQYRPVRPNLTPVKRSTNQSSEYSSYSDSQSKFQPVSPVAYSSNVNVKSSSNDAKSAFNKFKTYSYGGDASSSEIVKPSDFKNTYQRANSYEGYQHSVSESTDKSSFSKYTTEVKKIQKVEEIKKRFESRSTSYTDDVSYSHGDSNAVFSQSRIPVENLTSSKQSESFRSYKSNSQQFIDDIVNKVNSKQNELKQGALKSPSLYSPPVLSNEPQVFRDHYRNTEHVSSNEAGWISDIQRSSEAEYVIINGGSQPDRPQKAPIFITPLHDIAAVIGSLARFECIVQSDPPISIVWKKDGEVLRDTDLLQINFRNGVCKLTLLKTYKYDAGTYQCIAKNSGGVAETTATLTVSGERRSYIKK